MIRKLCFNIANYIYYKENTTHLKRHGYYYVLKLIISQLSEVVLILAIAFILGCFKETFVILITFILCRNRLQGFHAKKLKTCILFSTIILVCIGLISKYISILICKNIVNINVMNVNLIIMSISILLGGLLTLVTKNKKVTEKLQALEKALKFNE